MKLANTSEKLVNTMGRWVNMLETSDCILGRWVSNLER